jgi:acyl transferase domain-containing protein/acyl-CoA synthetase (AMP-forming)/AMP-acid ligase II/acyl carrier protein
MRLNNGYVFIIYFPNIVARRQGTPLLPGQQWTLSTYISTSQFEHSTLLELLRWRVEQQPEQRIYSFLADGETEKDFFTFSQLDRQARSIGALLQQYATSGERALLIYPAGLDFIAAFFGCLCSGVIAVPVYPPSATRSDRTLARFQAIAADAQPAFILTTAALFSRIEGLVAQLPELQRVRIIATSDLPANLDQQWREPAIRSESLAFLQYTSGSTGQPKGVMVTHGNLLHNASLIVRFCQHPQDAHLVTWLPLYHDLGLIGGVIQPLYAGFESTIMAPTAFLQRPIRWLQAASRYKATIIGGPNFAYDLCVRKITAEQKATLDLSHVEYAANGAEPVRAETLQRFAEAFAECGFRREAFGPCYGMAEATLVITAGRKLAFPGIWPFKAKELARNRAVMASNEDTDARLLVSCGQSLEDQKAIIVDPETRLRCADNQIGEIWVAGASVAQGYWRRPEETQKTFQARIADTGEGPFLRTGDLGFIHDDNLFITGRLKDLIIIRGRNHYPQDIELTVDVCHPAIKAGAGAAFSVEVAGEERLVVVQEIERQYLRSNLDAVVQAIRQSIAEQHELQTYAIVLLKTGTMLKTSSGKVQRQATKQAFLTDELEKIFEWRLELAEDEQSAGEEVAVTAEHAGEEQSAQTRTNAPSMQEIEAWLVARLAEALRVSPRTLDVHTPLASYGMDSAQAVSLSGDLEEWLGREFSPTLVYDYPSIRALATYLAGEPPASTPVEVARVEAAEARTYALESDAIAIVGLGCRFPKANDPEEFWQLLRDGIDGISEVPAQRWHVQELYEPEQARPGKMNTRWGGFLAQVDQFDPYFFGISPREAERMDPQQRLLLEVAWEALEHAGLAPDRLAGSQTGVFIGISSNDYSHLQFSDPHFIDVYAGTGNAHSIAANRLSYLLDLRGPSIAIDTACSSSLVAVHQACQSLRTGECDLAIAGGVNVILTPELTIAFSQGHMMSADGHCKTFDDAADGYTRSEGCGVVILKPLTAARRDGDNILALIRGSAVNQDGRSNGLTAPNGLAQEAVIRRALQNAGVTPDQISYVETHGSSTPLGDPIEVEALKSVLMSQRTNALPCILGAVKSNIGHLEAAAGIAGLIKTVLCLHKGEIPPNLHFTRLNSHISLDNTSFVIPTQRLSWPQSERRLAGVSAFGFGGTNAHVILEAAPVTQVQVNEMERPLHLLTLSARSKEALHQLAERYVAYLSHASDAALADICYTANTGRAQFAHRLAVSAASTSELRARLADFCAGRDVPGMSIGRIQGRERPGIAFLFTGQGSQYVGMGQQLYESQPTFRAALEKCDQLLRPYLERPLLSVMYPADHELALLHETAYTQPALFALEYALAELWRSWGIEPDIVMGHSVGEYVAACLAGIFSLEDGLRLIAERGRLMQALPERGAMVVVLSEPERVASALQPYSSQVAIAAVNGPRNTVISGAAEAVRAVARRLEDEGLVTHAMTVSHAFHSPLMEPMLTSFEQIARQIHFAPARIPLVCNLTGRIVNVGETLDAAYWKKQTRSTVQFAASMQTLAAQGHKLFVELGPHAVLSNMGVRCLPDSDVTWLPTLHKNRADWQEILQSVAILYTKGAQLNLQNFDRDYERHRMILPTYPFEREHCWFEIAVGETSRVAQTTVGATSKVAQAAHQVVTPWTPGERQRSWRHPLLAEHVELVYPTGLHEGGQPQGLPLHVWEVELDKQRLAYLNDHRIQGALAVPVSMYIEMAQAASTEAFGSRAQMLADLELKRVLFLPEHGTQKVQVVLSTDVQEGDTYSEGQRPAGLASLRPSARSQVSFHVYSHSAGMPEQPRNSWTLHASGKIRLN